MRFCLATEYSVSDLIAKCLEASNEFTSRRKQKKRSSIFFETFYGAQIKLGTFQPRFKVFVPFWIEMFWGPYAYTPERLNQNIFCFFPRFKNFTKSQISLFVSDRDLSLSIARSCCGKKDSLRGGGRGLAILARRGSLLISLYINFRKQLFSFF